MPTKLPPSFKNPAATAPASTPKPTERVEAAVETHQVQPGDTLSSLAQTYYGNEKYVRFLAESNPGLTDPNRLRVGTRIKIPPLPADDGSRAPGTRDSETTTSGSGKRMYTVKSGDSFYSIAKSQLGSGTRWREILSLNSTVVHGDPTALQPGQKLVLPES